MKASHHSVRIAPKKLSLIARMVRGMSVPDATESLRRTNKKGARILEKVLLSAVANASHNDKQDPQMMIVKTVVVNQAQSYRRGMPKARGQMRPYRKFLSHVEVVLGYAAEEKMQKSSRKQKKESETVKNASQKPKKSVSSHKTTKKNPSSESSASSASSAS